MCGRSPHTEAMNDYAGLPTDHRTEGGVAQLQCAGLFAGRLVMQSQLRVLPPPGHSLHGPRNAAASGQMRLALGTSRDVTIIEAAAEVVPCAEAPDPIARCYAARTGWDPQHEDVPHVYLVTTPRTMQAWKSLAEINGRTIMRDGQWTPA
jgi:hypothetical protein